MTPLQQTTFENIVEQEEITHDDQLHLLPNVFIFIQNLFFNL